MKLSCGLFPCPEIVEQAQLAEALGYERVWTYDSPALYGDPFIAMARVAEGTRRIGVGAAVLVPSLRHVLVTASAIASIEQLAPGRLAVAVGTGFTGRRMLGQRALSWRTTHSYIAQLKDLLAGKDVEVDGAITRMMHPDDLAPRRPIQTPILVAANGPVGLEVARELGDGVMCISAPQAGFDWCCLLAFGSVLEEGESLADPRVFEEAGPGVAVIYHGTYEASPEAVEALPGGAGWRQEVEAIPEPVRHLAVHEGHMYELSARDRRHVSPSMLAASFSGSPDQLRDRLREYRDQGLTELLYAPTGPTPRSGLEKMADVFAGL